MNLKGKCLIARPNLTDPMFKKSVVYIYEHSSRGTAGLVLSKKHHSLNSINLCSGRGFATDSVPAEPVWIGGPVSQKSVLMLHSTDWSSTNSIEITDSTSITSDDMMFFKYTTGNTPFYYKFFVGHSVWHPQQIRAEIQRNNWLITELDTETIFENDGRHLWDIAIENAAQETMDKFI